MLGDIFGRITPKAYIHIPLYFRDSNKYASKRVSIFSILIFAFLAWNSFNNLKKVGKIEGIF